jgi:dynein heavy chain
MRRQVYVTPKSYLSYLNSYKELYLRKYAELDLQESSYKIGLSKINDAAKQIEKMGVALREEEA